MRVCSVLCLSLMMNDGVQYCIPVLHEDIWILCIKRFIAYLICTHSIVYQSCMMMNDGMWWYAVLYVYLSSMMMNDGREHCIPVLYHDELWYAVVLTCPAWSWMMVCSISYLSRMMMNDGIQYCIPVPHDDELWYAVLYTCRSRMMMNVGMQ